MKNIYVECRKCGHQEKSPALGDISIQVSKCSKCGGNSIKFSLTDKTPEWFAEAKENTHE